MTVIVTELLLVLSILPSRGTPRQAPASPPLVQASAHISPSCPKAHRRAAAPILWAFGHKGFNQLNRADLSKLAQHDLRSLKQASACARLDQFYAGSTYDSGAWKREYFEAGAYYIAPLSAGTGGWMVLSRTWTAQYPDSDHVTQMSPDEPQHRDLQQVLAHELDHLKGSDHIGAQTSNPDMFNTPNSNACSDIKNFYS